MIITFVTAKVSAAQTDKLKEIFQQELSHMPAGLQQTFLINKNDLWKIVGIWENREKLEQMRKEKVVPAPIQMFRQVDTEPEVEIWDVV
jgi:hypothetical protein